MPLLISNKIKHLLQKLEKEENTPSKAGRES